MKHRVLFIEDDPLISRMVSDNLLHEGFDVHCVADGDKALNEVRSYVPDMILLDVMLPGLDGFEICRALKQSSTQIPIIVVSARSEPMDRIQGLNLGADDYVTKPFLFDELLARIHAVMRRIGSAPDVLQLGDIQIDFQNLRCSKGKAPVALTDREFEVLRLLANRGNKVVTRDELLRSVWGYSELPMTRTVDQFIARLRCKIEPDPRNPRYLHTVYGYGYRLTPKG